jgi:hypothetical protein
LLIFAVGVAIKEVYRHHKVTAELQEALDELDAAEPGWRLKDIEAAREIIPDDQNSALCTVRVSRLLPPNWPPTDLTTSLEELEPQRLLGMDERQRLFQETDRLRDAVVEARRLAGLPRGRHRIHYKRNVLETLLEDQQRVRASCWLMKFEAMRCDETGEAKGSLLCGRASLNAGRSLVYEPLSISQLVRIACVFQACQTVERTLAQGVPPESDLAEFQKLLEAEDSHPDLFIVMRGERAVWQEVLDALENEEGTLSQLDNPNRSPSWEERLLGWRIRDNLRADHPRMLRMMTRRVAMARGPAHVQLEQEQAIKAEVADSPKEAIISRILLPAVTKIGDACRRKQALVRCLIVAVAAERYRQKNGTWPVSLDKFGKDYLAAVPLDPFDGQPLRYRTLDDGVMIYSVSSDGRDNGGNLDRDHSNLPGADLGVRLWDVKHRRQPPRPREKMPEQPDVPD